MLGVDGEPDDLTLFLSPDVLAADDARGDLTLSFDEKVL